MCAVCFGAAQLVPAAAMGARAVLAKRRLERAGTVSDAELEELLDSEFVDSELLDAVEAPEASFELADPVERELSRS